MASRCSRHEPHLPMQHWLLQVSFLRRQGIQGTMFNGSNSILLTCVCLAHHGSQFSKLGSGIICSCSISWKASIWLLISWLENTQSLNSACYPHGCGIPELLHLKLLSGISSFRMITWSLKENKTAEKKDSLSSEWTNIDLWYDRKSNSMVSSQKWPPQFVSQYICHISGPSQAGPLQSTELRPPGP